MIKLLILADDFTGGLDTAVQFASRGFPLAGDRKYGGKIRAGAPALWARGISFPHPFEKDVSVSVSSEPPSVFPWNQFRC